MLGTWENDRAYTNAQGRPADLPFASDDPTVHTFSTLSRRHQPRIDPRKVLDELEGYGVVLRLGSDKIGFVRNYLRLNRADKDSALYCVKTLAEHLYTMTSNRQQSNPADTLYEKTAWTLDMEGESIPEFKAILAEQADVLIEFVDRYMKRRSVQQTTLPAGKPKRSKPSKRVSVCLYMAVS
jgi:hypothetical protein